MKACQISTKNNNMRKTAYGRCSSLFLSKAGQPTYKTEYNDDTCQDSIYLKLATDSFFPWTWASGNFPIEISENMLELFYQLMEADGIPTTFHFSGTFNAQ